MSAVSAPTPSTWRKRSVFRIVLLADRFQPTVNRADTLREGADRLQDGAQGRPERLGDVLGRLVVEASCRALGQLSTEGLYGSPDVVDQLRASTDQRLARADDRKMSLGVLTPVFEGVQEPRIHSRQASQILKASISSVFRLFV